MLPLTPQERKLFDRLKTPFLIQDYLDAVPINFEKKGETLKSPRRLIREQKAHCIEGALFAAAVLWHHGKQPLLLDFRTSRKDEEHVVTLFTINGYWGALSKTNHAILRYRDPVYATVRELAMSYFHEYFLEEGGHKTMFSFSKPFNLKTLGTTWVTTEEDMWHLEDLINKHPHTNAIPDDNKKYIRPVSPLERKMLQYREWKKTDPRT